MATMDAFTPPNGPNAVRDLEKKASQEPKAPTGSRSAKTSDPKEHETEKSDTTSGRAQSERIVNSDEQLSATNRDEIRAASVVKSNSAD